MTVVVEDGSIVANGNSYADETQLQDWADARGIDLTGANLTQLLVRSMDFIDTRHFKGVLAQEGQPLQFPRKGVVIDGYEVASDDIPVLLIKAQLATAVAIHQGFDPLSPAERAVKRERIYDAVEVEYMDNSASRDFAKDINVFLRKLIYGANNGVSFMVSKA